jgi:anti-anti-sigma regulatory factor
MASALKVAPTDSGCSIRVEGRGTMNESRIAADVAARTLASAENTTVVFDLTDCEYLDSTFLGNLLDLNRNYGRSNPPRCLVAASAERRQQLLHAVRIDKLIPAVDSPPTVRGDWVVLDTASHDRFDMMRHIMIAHRTLAQVESPMQGTFAKIAEQIDKDLKKRESGIKS